MNEKIKELNAELTKNNIKTLDIQSQLLSEYSKLFNQVAEIQVGIKDAENSNRYMLDNNGQIVSWTRVDLSHFQECSEYLNDYLSHWNIQVDWVNNCFKYFLGPDNIIVQDDTKYDNGVWLNSKLIIDESEYTDAAGEIDINKRNQLIEQYMEKTEYFPGVFRIDQYGNVFLVNTQDKLKG